MTKCVKQTFPKEAERSSNFVPSKKINTLKNSHFKEKIPLTIILFRPDLSFNACHSTTTAKKNSGNFASAVQTGRTESVDEFSGQNIATQTKTQFLQL